MSNKYEEIRCDYNPDGFWTVDAWEYDKEEGKVVALINDITGDSFMIGGEYDSDVRQIAKEKSEEVKSHILDRMKELFMG